MNLLKALAAVAVGVALAGCGSTSPAASPAAAPQTTLAQACRAAQGVVGLTDATAKAKAVLELQNLKANAAPDAAGFLDQFIADANTAAGTNWSIDASGNVDMWAKTQAETKVVTDLDVCK